jgi:subfamily B ATP-binding cassette protein MsbA
MNFATLKKVLLRLYREYIKNYLDKIAISFLLSLGVAGSTAAIAWLLDPAIEKMFMEQDNSDWY